MEAAAIGTEYSVNNTRIMIAGTMMTDLIYGLFLSPSNRQEATQFASNYSSKLPMIIPIAVAGELLSGYIGKTLGKNAIRIDPERANQTAKRTAAIAGNLIGIVGAIMISQTSLEWMRFAAPIIAGSIRILHVYYFN